LWPTAIASLEARIAEHQEKILLELERESPDQTLIHHWQKEIKADISQVAPMDSVIKLNYT